MGVRRDGRLSASPLGREQLAPPVMANDDIGREPKLLQVCRRMGNDVSTPERRIEFARRDMNLCRRTRRFGVRHYAYALDPVCIRLADEHDVMLLRPDEVPDDMQILAGKVLMDEQKLHGLIGAASA